jgi:hypothetical protein
MSRQITNGKPGNSRWEWLYNISGVSALVTGMLLLIGMGSLIASVLQPGIANSWLSFIRDNWLVKIFILHAEFRDISADLHGLSLLDMLILIFVSIICFSISTIFKKARKVWSRIAFTLSLIAIILFLVTQIAGRSTVMLAVLIISLIMFGDKTFRKVFSYAGILAGIFLFIGDLTVGVHSNIITILFGIGYVLLMIWFFLMAPILYRLGRPS